MYPFLSLQTLSGPKSCKGVDVTNRLKRDKSTKQLSEGEEASPRRRREGRRVEEEIERREARGDFLAKKTRSLADVSKGYEPVSCIPFFSRVSDAYLYGRRRRGRMMTADDDGRSRKLAAKNKKRQKREQRTKQRTANLTS